MPQRVRVFAPASVSNLGPGFDVLGLALPEPGDYVEAEPSPRPGVEIVAITGDGGELSHAADRNVAAVAAAHVLARIPPHAVAAPASGGPRAAGVRLWLHKGMPLASGLGSSAASSVAGAVAVNELFGRPLARRDLLASAMEGERVASGAAHADNVAPSLLGGIVAIRSYAPLDVVELPVPPRLVVVVVHPHCRVATAEARAILAGRGFALADAVANVGNMAAFVHALHRGDLALLGRSVEDRLVEPLRAHLVPGFAEVVRAARAAGALGCSMAGAGPSVFALAIDPGAGERIGRAMQAAFDSAAHLDSDLFMGAVNTVGAKPAALRAGGTTP
jgi:homoserine kinase